MHPYIPQSVREDTLWCCILESSTVIYSLCNQTSVYGGSFASTTLSVLGSFKPNRLLNKREKMYSFNGMESGPRQQRSADDGLYQTINSCRRPRENGNERHVCAEKKDASLTTADLGITFSMKDPPFLNTLPM